MESNIVLFEDSRIRKIEKDGQIWIAAVDVAKALGYSNPSAAITDMIVNKEVMFEGYVKNIPLSSKGGMQKSYVLNLEGVIMFLISSNMPKAIPFKKWAVKELKKIITKSPDDVEAKIKLKRLFFTDQLKEHGATKPYHYSNITKSMKADLGYDRNKKKEEMELIDKMKIAIAEDLASINLLQSQAANYYDCKVICDTSAKLINDNTKQIGGI